MPKCVRDLGCCSLQDAFEMQAGVDDGRVYPKNVGWDRRERLWVTGKQRGAEGPGAVAKVCAGSVRQSTWRGKHTGELCKQQEARKKPPASSGAVLGRNMVALGDSAHNSWAPLLPDRATLHLHARESSLASLAWQKPAQGCRTWLPPGTLTSSTLTALATTPQHPFSFFWCGH